MKKNQPSDFWRHVKKTDTCWLWISAKNRKGYGQFTIAGKMHISHRYVFQQTNGTIPLGLCVLHRCDNPPCVNPEHLFLGTNQDNVDDKMRKRRHWTFKKDRCRKGHIYTPETMRIRKADGSRCCKICERVLCKKWYRKNKEYRQEYHLRRYHEKKAILDGK